jgi:hypothetical protein
MQLVGDNSGGAVEYGGGARLRHGMVGRLMAPAARAPSMPGRYNPDSTVAIYCSWEAITVMPGK